MGIKTEEIYRSKEVGEEFLYFDAIGYSMWPFLRAGQRIIARKIPPQELQVGDIILYNQADKVVCHRLVKVIKGDRGSCLYARGDNSTSRAELIPEEMYLGKAVAVIKAGRVINLNTRAQRGLGRLIIIIGPFFGQASRMIKKIFRL